MSAANPFISWLEISPESDFSLQNLPYGVGRYLGGPPRVLSALGDYAIDLNGLQAMGHLDGIDLPDGIFAVDTLNPFIELGKPVWRAVRKRLQEIFSSSANSELASDDIFRQQILRPQAEMEMVMPVFVRDYTDFYASEYHATNVGTMFRGKENALMPNWKHLPVGYHGRASSIIVSGQPIHRPKGQLKPDDAAPVYGPSRLLDFELEMGLVVGKGNELGDSISVAEAEDHIFGLVLFNDWSARDIQKWEYVPLGPFLGKSFASSISPWIVTLDALEPYRVENPAQDPPVLPYLEQEGARFFDLNLEVGLQSANQPEKRISLSNSRFLYWSMAQMIAHHTVNGCNLNVGDMMASG
ncbi:MAG: fumarylacetoacetase, partial [Bacteroidota bacterium]